jgi:hypothetical protein
MIASLRFNGLEVVAAALMQSVAPSASLDRVWFIGAVISILKGIFFCFSKLANSVGLMLPLILFSCPIPNSCELAGVEFPLSEATLNTRLIGLLGEVRDLEAALGGAVLERLVDRRESFTLGGNGLANGDGVCVGVVVKVETA